MTSDLNSRLKELESGSDLATVLALYDSLPPATPDQMIGSWHGGEIPTGNAFDGLLEQFGWYGKRFDSVDAAYPLIFASKKNKLFSVNPGLLPMSLVVKYMGLVRTNAVTSMLRFFSPLFASRKPHARLRMMEYRGVVSATMIYDALPINDAFRAVDADTLVGAMDYRGLDQPFMFTLRRRQPITL